MLKKLWAQANSWVVASNGQVPAYNNAIGKTLAKQQAIKHLDDYFTAIDALLPKDEKHDQRTDPEEA